MPSTVSTMALIKDLVYLAGTPTPGSQEVQSSSWDFVAIFCQKKIRKSYKVKNMFSALHLVIDNSYHETKAKNKKPISLLDI